jgi:hypothetical protein
MRGTRAKQLRKIAYLAYKEKWPTPARRPSGGLMHPNGSYMTIYRMLKRKSNHARHA